MRLFIFAIAIALGSFIGFTISNAIPPKVEKGVLYDKARATLILTGWSIVPPNEGDTCFGYDGLHCGKYPEARDCSGSGLALCTMVWSKDGTIKIVTTAGETSPIVFN